MMNIIQQIKVSPHGAELTNLVANGREYLWQGDARYWGRRAPILFPIVGRLADDILRIDGKEYTMKQHGFARDKEFVPLQLTTTYDFYNGFRNIPTNEPIFMQMLHDEPIENYPYDFDLKVRYAIYGNTLEIKWEVQNTDDKPMFFQIGAHPAFVLPNYDSTNVIHGYLRCYNSQGQMVLPVTTSHLEEGLRVLHEPKEVENKKGMIPITNTLFANDAILLDGGNITSVGLLDNKEKEILRVSCSQAEVFGLWAPNKPGCPFVCIEPWCGIADSSDFSGDVSERECIHKLVSGTLFTFSYSIQIA